MKFSFNLSFDLGSKRKDSNTTCRSFIEKANTMLEQMTDEIRFATLRNYYTAINSFDIFLRETNIENNPLTHSVICRYMKWLHVNNKCENTISNYTRCLRAVYNNLDLHKDVSPFLNLSLANSPTKKRTLTISEIQALQELKVNGSLRMYLDIFLFSVYTFGIPFVDLVGLRYTNISGNVIAFNRHKTGKQVVVCLLPDAADIIDKYHSADSDYVFPEVSISNSDKYTSYQYQLTKYNNALRRIQKLAKLNVPLTSYVARHTWASTAYASGVDVGIISQALGHTNIRTTQIYLKQLDSEKIRTAGMLVLQNLTKTTVW